MSTLTIELSDAIAERVARLRPVDKMRLDNAMREVVNAVVLAAASGSDEVPSTWEELTGFSDEEEDAFNRLEGHYPALLSASVATRGHESDDEDGVWQHLQ